MAKLILAPGETEHHDAIDCGEHVYWACEDPIQKQRRIGAAVVLREMASDERNRAEALIREADAFYGNPRPDRPLSGADDQARRLVEGASRLEARAAELEAGG